MKKITETALKNLFLKWSGVKVETFAPLPQSGSYRKYYRISNGGVSAIGVYNPDKKENQAFVQFTNHFSKHKLPVTEIYSEDLDADIYLIKDLGDTTLFSFLTDHRQNDAFPDAAVELYKKVLVQLPRFQIEAAKDFDYTYCYPRPAFDKQSMLWDLHYFKYYFLKLTKIPFNEQNLEDSFHAFADFLLEADSSYFLYRDFQSRNIMIVNRDPFFIDYQGGRKGALQYDLASMLYDAKADIPNDVRSDLLNYYMEIMQNYPGFKQNEFEKYFYGYVIIRILQALGAYGFRGFYEKKEHFLKSIPYAIKNLERLMRDVELPSQLSYLKEIINGIICSEEIVKYGAAKKYSGNLTTRIFSFSYRKSIPADTTGNGGGFVFDCRAINNPGRHEQYKQLTGKDEPVIEFLRSQSDADKFLESVFSLVDSAVENYLERDFPDLMISFGCTGGQHRSVYCAESLAKHLNEKYKIRILLEHVELNSVAANGKAIQINPASPAGGHPKE